MTSRQQAQRQVNDLHVYGIITIALDLCLCLENLLPVLVVIFWRRPRERTVCDKLVASLSATYVMSALVPTPLGLVSYFHGTWYGGAATCECFQVTSTWCSLSALALVTYLSVDLHLSVCTRSSQAAHMVSSSHHVPNLAPSLHSQPSTDMVTSASRSGRDCANILLFALFTVTLLIASLPVVGYGPEVMPRNNTCDSWLIDTPRSSQRRTYFVMFLAFGFFNLLTVVLNVTGTLLALRSAKARAGWKSEPRYTDEVRGHSLDARQTLQKKTELDSQWCYKMAGVILANQAMWIPALIMVTVQKAGYPITDATMMYTILSTSLPGLLNPLLLALLYGDYRQGYRYVLYALCCRCYARDVELPSNMKHLRSKSLDSLPEDGELTLDVSVRDDDEVNSVDQRNPACCLSKKSEWDNPEIDALECNSYLVIEVPDERTPLQGAASTSSRPIIASLYDEYGELSGAPKTELLSPCGSEECLLNQELFRVQSESVL